MGKATRVTNDIRRFRFARGEISEDEFEQRKRVLTSSMR
jgi:uncharacterized membrane protein